MAINHQEIYKLIAKIPKGKVSTYKLLAEAYGSKAYRAVATIVGKNKNIPTIPCHRIVKNNGEVGDYALGKNRKIELLVFEGVDINENKIVNFDKKLFKF